MEGSLCFGNPSAEGGFDPHSPIFQTSFYHGTPSPADSGVMSPTTPLGSWPSSTPEHLTNGFQLSPNRVHSGPDEVHSPFPMTSPMSSNDDERNLCAQNYVVSDPWQLQPFHVVGGPSSLSAGNGTGVFRQHLNSQSTHFSSSGSLSSHVESLCEKVEVMAHLDDQLEHEGGPAAETLHSIAGGLQVIEDADLAAILKEADPENFEPHLNDDDGDDDDSSSNDNFAPTSTREASMTAGTMSDSIPDAVGRLALQSQDPRPKWSSSSNVGYRSTSGANFVGKTSASSTMVSAGLAITSATSTCDIRSGTKFGNLARQRHLSGRKRKSRSHLKSRSSALPPAVLSPYSQPPTLQPHFVQQSGVPHHSVALLPQHPSSAGSGTKQPPQLVHHQLQQQQDLDLYLNSSASNVSPDSGIQSEGGVNNSSPLHLGDVTLPVTTTPTAVSTILTTTSHPLHNNFVQTQQHVVTYHHSPQLGQTFSTAAGTAQAWNQSSSYYGSYVSPSYQTGSHIHNQSYVYPAGQSPVATLVVAAETITTQATLHPQYFSQKSPVFRVNHRTKSPSASHHSSSSSSEQKFKRGRGRPKGSKNKVQKKMTMDCAIQTIESSLDVPPVIVSSSSCIQPRKPHSRSSSRSCSGSDSDTSSGSSPPPLPVFMGSSAVPEAAKSIRGRPPKDPPRLLPEVTPPPLSTQLPPPPPPPPALSSVYSSPKKLSRPPKEKVISLSPRIRTLSTLKTSCEVIMLDSDDSTVFSDNNDDTESDNDDDVDKVEAKIVKEHLEEVVIAAKAQLPSPRLPLKLPSPKVKPLKIAQIKHPEKPVPALRSVCPSGSDQDVPDRSESPEPPVLLAADEAMVEKEEPPKLKIISKPKKHRKSEEERGRRKSKHKSKKSKKEKKKRRRKSRSDSPPKIDRESSLSPVRTKSKSRQTAETSRDRGFGRAVSPVLVSVPVPSEMEKVPAERTPKSDNSINRLSEKLSEVPKNDKSSTVSSFSNGKTEPVFDSKYRSLKPDEFWKHTDPTADKEPAAGKPVVEKKPPRSSSVSSKPAIKEVSPPPIPPNLVSSSTVKTMLQVLAVASKRGKPGRKPKRDRKSLEWAEPKIGVSPGSSCHSSQRSPFSPQSSIGAEAVSNPIYTHVQESTEGYKKKKGKKEKEKRKKKKKKADGTTVWKSKHKNVIDPVLLGEVEHLIRDLLSLQISSKMSKDFWPDRPKDSVPSIFRRRKILMVRSKSGNVQVVDKPVAKRGRPKKNVQPVSSTMSMESSSKKNVSDFDALIASTSDAAEQRLPLKKRHHHHIQKDPNCSFDSESGNSSSGCCAQSPPLKPPTSSQRRSSVHNRNESTKSGRSTDSGRSSRKPSVEDATGRDDKPTRETATPALTSTKSRIKILEERCETILKENNSSRGTKKTADNSSSSTKQISNLEVEKPATSNSIVESIAACVDKYTGSRNQKKEAAQKLLILTSPTSTNVAFTPKSSSSLTSPRKRHLMEMREKEERESRQARSTSPPPLLLPPAVSSRGSTSESLPPPQLEKATSALAEKSKKLPLRISVEKLSELEREPPLLTLPSPPRLSPDSSAIPDLASTSVVAEAGPSNLLIRADQLEKKPVSELPAQPPVLIRKRGRPPKKPKDVAVNDASTAPTAGVKQISDLVPKQTDISTFMPPNNQDLKESCLHVAEPVFQSRTEMQETFQTTKEAGPASVAEERDEPAESEVLVSPCIVVPKILKATPANQGSIRTQSCSVRVEKLTEEFVNNTKKRKMESVKNLVPVPQKANDSGTAELEERPDGTKAAQTTKILADDKDKLFDSLFTSTPPTTAKKEKPVPVASVRAQPDVAAKLENPTNREKLKKRKRKANRTGFPASKKKKKIVSSLPEPKTPKPLSRPPSVAEQLPQSMRSSSRLQESAEQQPPLLLQAAVDEAPITTLPVLPVKGKRGRPPKNRTETGSLSAAKRSRIYDEADEETDCLSLLPVSESSGPSSEAQSSAETDDVVIGGHNDGGSIDSKKRKKRKQHKLSSIQPPFKKNHLVAGLFSEFYKTTSTPLAANESNSKKLLSYNLDEHAHGLLPPPYYCGRQLRQKKEDFQLPYDLWWLHAHKQLPGRDVVATWNYKRIKNNVFYDIKPLANFEAQACHCKPGNSSTGCGDDCINRMTYSECDQRLCPLGDKCTNNQIQKHRGVTGLERFMTEEKGWGVRSKIKISIGEFVMEYVGEVVSEKEFKLRMLTEYVDDTHHYCLHLDGGAVIDGHRMGGECRFVNHSCRPNCEMQKWTVNGLYRMALFTLRDIEPGEELTYDYNFSLFNPHEGQACRCGAHDCRGVIGGRSQRINGLVGKSESKSSESKQTGQPSTPSSSASSVSGVSENRGRDRKKIATVRRPEGSTPTRALQLLAQVKPMSHQQRCFAQEHRCFLLRNLEKVRRVREKIQRKVAGATGGNFIGSVNSLRDDPTVAAIRPEQMILTGLTALATARSMQTRRLAIAQDDPNVTKVVKLAQLLREIFAQVTSMNDSNGRSISRFFNSIPTKKHHPLYTTLITEPVDFLQIDRNINTGYYNSAEQFDADLLRLFQNNLRYFGHNSQEGKAALKLRQMYNTIKSEYHGPLCEILGLASAVYFLNKTEMRTGNEDDAIDCVCGQYKDEGLMVQCERCHVWQHCDCVGHPEGEENFFCQNCDGPKINLDIKLTPQPEYASPGETYYVSLMREDLQVRLGDTVYVLRAFKAPKDPEISETGSSIHQDNPGSVKSDDSNDSSADQRSESEGHHFTHGGIPHKMVSPLKGPAIEASSLTKGNYPTFKTVDAGISTDDMDIFRIERLWINEKGERFAFGHHFLRPHETFHEPNRKFFRNEVFRVPLYEVLPLDTIWNQCWVLDYPTFVKGRPIGSVEEHVYICEYRVDKSARLFNKISKPKYPICTKKFAFHHFDQRLKPTRIYTPHEVPDRWKPQVPRSRSVSDDRLSAQSDNSIVRQRASQKTPSMTSSVVNVASKASSSTMAKPKTTPALTSSTSAKFPKLSKLESTLQKLLSKTHVKSRVDASYLLEHDKRTRKRTQNHKNPESAA